MVRNLALLLMLCASGCAGRGERVAAASPDGTLAGLDVARAAEASGQPEIALNLYASAARRTPNDPQVQARYAAALAEAGRPEEARAALAAPLRAHPADATLLRALGGVDLRAGLAAEAEGVFARVLAIEPGDPGATDGRAVALDLEGQYAQAATLHRRVLAAEPGNARYVNNAAVSRMLAGDMGEAIAILRPWASRGDAPPRVRTNLALAEVAMTHGVGMARRPVPAVLSQQASAADVTVVVQALASPGS